MTSPYSHFVNGLPVVLRGEPALAVGAGGNTAGQNFQSLLAGRTVGGFKPLTFPTGAIPQAALVDIAGPSEASMAMTVTLAPPPFTRPNPVATISPAPNAVYPQSDGCVAMVSWGSGGVLSFAEIDFGKGCSFTLNCSALQILARREIPPTGGTAQASEEWGAFVSHLPCARTAPLTRTVRSSVAVNAGAASLAIPVPPYGKTVRISTQFGTSFFELQMFDIDAVQIATFLVGAGQYCPEFVLPNDCAFVLINNTSAININLWRAVFALAL
jgi:hypothetical protein